MGEVAENPERPVFARWIHFCTEATSLCRRSQVAARASARAAPAQTRVFRASLEATRADPRPLSLISSEKGPRLMRGGAEKEAVQCNQQGAHAERSSQSHKPTGSHSWRESAFLAARTGAGPPKSQEASRPFLSLNANGRARQSRQPCSSGPRPCP